MGQIVGVSSLSPLGSWELNSGCKAWHQAPLPGEPSHQPYDVLLWLRNLKEDSMDRWMKCGWPFTRVKFTVERKTHTDEVEDKNQLKPKFALWLFIKVLMRLYNTSGLYKTKTENKYKI